MKLKLNNCHIANPCLMLSIFVIKNKHKKVTSESGNGGTVQEKFKFLINNLAKIQFSNNQRKRKDFLKILD